MEFQGILFSQRSLYFLYNNHLCVWGWPPNMGKCLTLIEACDSLCQRTYPQPGLRPLAPPSAVPRQSVTEMPKPRNRLARFRWSHQAMEWSKESKVFVPYPIPKFEAARMMILPYFSFHSTPEPSKSSKSIMFFLSCPKAVQTELVLRRCDPRNVSLLSTKSYITYRLSA